jgi:DNA-binding response OmpR family regulator
MLAGRDTIGIGDRATNEMQKRIARASAFLRQRGYIVVEPTIVEPSPALVVGPLSLDVVSATVVCGTKQVGVTPFKVLLLRALMEADGAWCSRRALRKLLWGKSVPESDALAVHMHHLRRQVTSCTGMEIIQASRRRGFRLAVEKFGNEPDALAPVP